MVDTYGRWTPEADYSAYPKEKWCDLDRVADYIRKSGYQVQIDLERFIDRISYFFEEDGEFEPVWDENNMINIPMLHEYVEASGGLKEFDYEC
jgi:hypothetical protein